jgi:hypothetical protein
MKKCFHESEGERMIDDEVMARYRERMTALAESFPMLGQADGVHPWDADCCLARYSPGTISRSTARA